MAVVSLSRHPFLGFFLLQLLLPFAFCIVSVPDAKWWNPTAPASLPSVERAKTTLHRVLFEDSNSDLDSWKGGFRVYEGDFEFYWNTALQLPTGGTIIEVGSFQGASVVIWGTALRASGNLEAKIISVDICKQWYTHVFDANIYKFQLSEMVTRVCKPSVEAAEEMADSIADVIYVDASHKYQSVLDDVRAWFPKLKPTGLMAGHDGVEPQVLRAAYAFSKNITRTNYPHQAPGLQLHCCHPDSKGIWHFAPRPVGYSATAMRTRTNY